MSAYPDLPLQDNSQPHVDGGFQASRATNGRLRVRRLYADEKYSFDLVHVLVREQYDALMAHYRANKDASFSFTWPLDGRQRTMQYTDAPLLVEVDELYVVNVKLAEV